jgi:hypothetical protein
MSFAALVMSDPLARLVASSRFGAIERISLKYGFAVNGARIAAFELSASITDMHYGLG